MSEPDSVRFSLEEEGARDPGGPEAIPDFPPATPELFRIAFENSSLGMAVIDPDGRWLSVNPAYARILGHTTRELAGANFPELTLAEDRAEGEELLKAVLQGDARSVRFEERYRHRDGSVIHARIHAEVIRNQRGEPRYLLSLAEDVTAARRTELAAPREELVREAMMDAVLNSVISLDLQGRVLDWNAAAERMFSFSRQEVIGHDLIGLVVPGDLRPAFREGLAALTGGDAPPISPVRGEAEAIDADGRRFAVEVSVARVDPPNGGAPILVAYVRDVSERRRMLARGTALAAIGERALVEPDLPALAQFATEEGRRALEADACRFLEMSGDSGELVALASSGFPAETVGLRVATETSPFSGAALERGVVVVPDWSSETSVPRPELLERMGVQSGMSIVVSTVDGPIGAFSVLYRAVHTFGDEELEFGRAVAHVLGSAFERGIHEESMRDQALVDELTGLPNRVLVLERLERVLARSTASLQTGVVLVDLDGFGRVNGTLGHAAGDEILREVVERLRACISPEDTLARIAADQFAVLRPVLGDRAEGLRLARSLMAAVDQPFGSRAGGLRLTASAGLALAGAGARAGDVLRDAHAAVGRAKRVGGGVADVFDEALRSDLMESMRTEGELRLALERGELMVVYQPVVLLADQSLVGVEALVRWQHPQFGLLLPGRFLPVAERADLMVPIGTYVLRAACDQLVRWSKLGRPLKLYVNVSAQQIEDPGFVDVVTETLAGSGADPESLVLEITETVLMRSSGAPAAALASLEELGVCVYLDDFGTGYSSLSYLRQFPLDGLKIDRSFVADLAMDAQARSIVDAIAGMARALGLSLVAEGIETGDQRRILQDLGCQIGQGYLFARPAPPEQMEAIFEAAGRPREDVTDAPDPGPPAVATSSDAGRVRAAGATVTLREAAAALGVSASTVRRWSDEGRIPAERTAGGHRRFRLEDVRRLRAGTRSTAVRLRTAELPDRAFPAVAEALTGSGSASISVAVKATYEGRAFGWFGEDSGRAAGEEWVAALASAFESGDYEPALAATNDFLRRAELGGAAAAERFTFLERFGRVATRLLSGVPDAREEMLAVQRLWALLQQHALARF